MKGTEKQIEWAKKIIAYKKKAIMEEIEDIKRFNPEEWESLVGYEMAKLAFLDNTDDATLIIKVEKEGWKSVGIKSSDFR